MKPAYKERLRENPGNEEQRAFLKLEVFFSLLRLVLCDRSLARSPGPLPSSLFYYHTQSPSKSCRSCSPGAEASTSETARRRPCRARSAAGAIGAKHGPAPGRARGDDRRRRGRAQIKQTSATLFAGTLRVPLSSCSKRRRHAARRRSSFVDSTLRRSSGGRKWF